MSDIKPVETGPARSDVVGETEPVKADLSHYDAELEEALRNYVPGSDAEKRLVRKLDMYLMPTVWFMYILAYIDRQNIVSRGSPHAGFSIRGSVALPQAAARFAITSSNRRTAMDPGVDRLLPGKCADRWHGR